jgi:hypothetical protein
MAGAGGVLPQINFGNNVNYPVTSQHDGMQQHHNSHYPSHQSQQQQHIPQQQQYRGPIIGGGGGPARGGGLYNDHQYNSMNMNSNYANYANNDPRSGVCNKFNETNGVPVTSVNLLFDGLQYVCFARVSIV